MLPPYSGTEYPFSFQKKRTGGHSEKILNQSKTKTSMIHTKSCSSMSRCLVSRALVGCPSSIAACSTDGIRLCVASVVDGSELWFPTTAPVTGLFMASLQKPHPYHMLLGLLKPRRKEESRNLSFFHASKASTMWEIPQN